MDYQGTQQSDDVIFVGVHQLDTETYRIVSPLSNNEMAALMYSVRETGSVQVPIEIDEQGGVIDGIHRVLAAIEAGLDEVPAIVRPGLTEQQKRDQALRLNLVRRHLSVEQRKQLAEGELLRNPARSDRSIAEKCGIAHPTVGKIRRRLEEERAIEPVHDREGRDGVTQDVSSKRNASDDGDDVSAPRCGVIAHDGGTLAEVLGYLVDVDVLDLPDGLTLPDVVRKFAEATRTNDARDGQEDGTPEECDTERGEEQDNDAEAEAKTEAEVDGGADADSASDADADDETDGEPESDDAVEGDLDLAVFDLGETGDLEELAAASERLLDGAYLLVRVSPADVADVIGALGELEYVWTFAETAVDGETIADPIPVRRRWMPILMFRKQGGSRKQRLIDDLLDAGDEVEVFRTLIETYSHPGNRVLGVSEDIDLEAICDSTDRVIVSIGDPVEPVSFTDRGLPTKSAFRPSAGAVEVGSGQLTASIDADGLVTVRRGSEALAVTRAVPTRLSNRSFVDPSGNTKTDTSGGDGFGIINGLSQACFRSAMSFSRCDRPCYSNEDGTCGCFATRSPWAARGHNVFAGYNVTHNGLANDLFQVRIPADDDWSLEAVSTLEGPATYRIDSASADASMSVSLGLFQRWAEANPRLSFFGFSANYFRPDADKLDWLSSLDNAWMGHSTSAWFSDAETRSRFDAIERFLDAGVPSIIFVCTSPEWDNESVAERAVDLVGERHVIEVPYRSGHLRQRPVLGTNPLGACGDMEYDADGRLVTWREDGDRLIPMVEVGGEPRPANGHPHSRCHGCRLRCGYNELFEGADLIEETVLEGVA